MAGTTTRRPAPTLEAVAAVAGVSRSTVSRVINGSSQVSPDVVAAVNAAVAELRYLPNRAARSLARRKTMAIALVVPEDTTRFFGDPFFSEVVKGITEGLEPSDYVLNLQLAHPSAPSEKTIGYLLGGNVDGAIVVSHHSGDDFFATLDATIPVVFGGRPFRPEIHDSSYVDVDNSAGAALGVQHLIDIGRRKIATIAGPADMQAAIDRTDGWVRTLRAAGIPTKLLEHGDFTQAGGASAMRALLQRSPDLDGVFVASDLMAVGAVDVLLREFGKRVPQDVAVVGFDDSPAAVSGAIPLTTVHQPQRQMGRAMAQMLLDRLSDDGDAGTQRLLLDTHLVVRDSA
jgi:DNA-binding LacI/PurR family transcriptional regulator